MRVRNVHHRILQASVTNAEPLLDGLASPTDRLWPNQSWPRLQFDRPLQVGAVGGHGPIRYTVVAYEPGRRVEFAFIAPQGFNGGHRFEVTPHGEGSRLVHTLEMRTSGLAILSWPLIFRPLHDALVEDGLSLAQRHLQEAPLPASWSPWVRFLRRVLASPRRRRPIPRVDAAP